MPDPTAEELLAARPHLTRHVLDGLMLEDVPLAAVAAAAGTPCWVYGAATMRGRLAALRGVLAEAGLGSARVHYAVKANDHLAVLALMRAGGAGADVVSGGELARALRAGMAPADVVFSGVGKSRAELVAALAAGIGQINVESAEELAMLSAVAQAAGRVAAVALRVNPDVDALTHDKISTGRAGDKFGIALGEAAGLYAAAAAMPGVRPVGLAVHIGSQIATMAPYRAAFERVAALVRGLRETGQAVEVVDCGGGLGIGEAGAPAGSPAALAGAIRASFGGLGVRIVVEPGRWLVGPAGVLLSAVVLCKRQGVPRPLVVLDAAMNDLLRPALYGAWHGVLPVAAGTAAGIAAPLELVDVVGPVCESADVLAQGRWLPPLPSGALVALLDAGAYGATMSSTYNARPLAAQVMVDGARLEVIRPRQALEALWAGEVVPEALIGAGVLVDARHG